MVLSPHYPAAALRAGLSWPVCRGRWAGPGRAGRARQGRPSLERGRCRVRFWAGRPGSGCDRRRPLFVVCGLVGKGLGLRLLRQTPTCRAASTAEPSGPGPAGSGVLTRAGGHGQALPRAGGGDADVSQLDRLAVAKTGPGGAHCPGRARAPPCSRGRWGVCKVVRWHATKPASQGVYYYYYIIF